MNPIKIFITKWTDDTVSFYWYLGKEHRISKRMPLFAGMRLFRGKNVVIETQIAPGTMTVKCIESKSSRIVQLWNFYVRGKF